MLWHGTTASDNSSALVEELCMCFGLLECSLSIPFAKLGPLWLSPDRPDRSSFLISYFPFAQPDYLIVYCTQGS
jgi:hypothetical protein